MKVLYVAGAGERGGAERALLAQAKLLPGEGFEPAVAFLNEGPFVQEVIDHGIETLIAPIRPRARKIWSYRKVVKTIRGFIDQTKPDLVLASGEHIAIYSGWAARSRGLPCVVWLHDAPLRDLRSTFVQLAMLASPHDAYAAGSVWMSKAFKRKLRIDVTPCPYGVDTDLLPAEPVNLRAEAGWPEDALVVGHFGRLQKWKGQDVFIRAAAKIHDSYERARFLIVGGALFGWEEEYAKNLPQLANSLGLGSKIFFAGHRADALAVMAGCDIVVHSSVELEPLGIVVAEAFGLGRPTVATQVLGPEEIIDDGKTGLLVPPRDAEALGNAMAVLLGDPQRRAEMGAAALQSFYPYWTANRMTSDFAALFRRVLSR